MKKQLLIVALVVSTFSSVNLQAFSAAKKSTVQYVQDENTVEGKYKFPQFLKGIVLNGDRASVSITVDPTVKNTTLLVQRVSRRTKTRPKKTIIETFVKDAVLYIKEKNTYSFSMQTLETLIKFSSSQCIKYELITPYPVSFEAKAERLRLVYKGDLKDINIQNVTVLAGVEHIIGSYDQLKDNDREMTDLFFKNNCKLFFKGDKALCDNCKKTCSYTRELNLVTKSFPLCARNNYDYGYYTKYYPEGGAWYHGRDKTHTEDIWLIFPHDGMFRDESSTVASA